MLDIGNRLQVPVVRLISKALILCPKTLNCGRDTSLETPTDLGPSFHLYRISLMVYPTVFRDNITNIIVKMSIRIFSNILNVGVRWKMVCAQKYRGLSMRLCQATSICGCNLN